MPQVILYPLDLTGKHPDNKVVGEIIGPAAPGNRAFVLRHGAFYTRNLVIRRKDTNVVLQPRVDYKAVQLEIDATLASGLQACQVIIVEPSAFGVELLVDLQYVGGQYSTTTTAIREMLDALDLDGRVIRWGDIIGKPEGFKPAPHFHDIGDVYGFEFVVAALEGIRNAILMGDVRAWDEFRDYVDNQDQILAAQIQDLSDRLDAHLRDYNNPHRTNKGHTGLGNVENLPLATEQIAREGISNVHYLTPYLAKILMDEHASRRDNPHGTNKGHVGLGLVDNFATATIAIALAGTSNIHFLTPAGMAAFVEAKLEGFTGGGGFIQPPAPGFSYTGNLSSPSNVPHVITFSNQTNQGTNAIVSTTWDFGDGTTFNGQTPPPHTYTFAEASKAFTVTLTVKDTDGIERAATRNFTLVKTAALVPPTVSFTVVGELTFVEPRSTTSIQFNKNVTPGSAQVVHYRLENLTTGDFMEHGPSDGAYFPWNFTQDTNGSRTYRFKLTATDSNGFAGTFEENVTITRQALITPPTPAIKYTGATSAYTGNPIVLSFDDNTTMGNQPITAYNWRFSNGQTYAGRTPGQISFNVAKPGGTIWAELTVTAGGQTYVKTENITVTVMDAPINPPSVSIQRSGSLTITSGTTTTLTFTTNGTTAGTGSLVSASWAWGDGTTINPNNLDSQTKTYTVLPGESKTFTVSLTVRNSNNLETTGTTTFTITNSDAVPQPSGDWTYSGQTNVQNPSNPNVSFSAAFSASPFTVSNIDWDFGDGTFGTGANTSHVYNVPIGTHNFNVRCVVYSSGGTSVTVTKTITVTKSDIPPSVADFTVGGSTSVTEPTNHSITVTDASSAGGSTITSWSWNWGDGSANSTGKAPGAHTYTVAAGQTKSFTIVLTITDALGRTSTKSQSITLTKLVSAGPTASFNATPNNSNEPYDPSVSVTDTSVGGGAAITGYSWNWGDGTTATGKSPGTKTYTGVPVGSSRDFTITLTVTDALGKTSTATRTVTVRKYAASSPDVSISTSGSTTVAHNQTHSITFGCTASGGTPGYSYAWNINGAAYSTRNPGAITFSVPAGTTRNFSASVTVTDSLGYTGYDSVTITLTKGAVPVGPKSQMSLSGATTVAHNQTHSITCTDASTPGSSAIVGWEWDFGDGNFSGSKNPGAKTYAVNPGTSATFPMRLTVVDANGLGDVSYNSLVLTKNAIPVAPTAHFTFAPANEDGWYTVNHDQTHTITFDGSGSPPGSSPITSYRWTIDGAQVSTAASFSRSFTVAPGSRLDISVQLTVTNAQGLSSTVGHGFFLQKNAAPATNPKVKANVTWSSTSTHINYNASGQVVELAGGAPITKWEWTGEYILWGTDIELETYIFQVSDVQNPGSGSLGSFRPMATGGRRQVDATIWLTVTDSNGKTASDSSSYSDSFYR